MYSFPCADLNLLGIYGKPAGHGCVMKTWSCPREQTRITWECLFIWIAFYRAFPSVHRIHWEVKWLTFRRQRPASSHPRSCFHFQKGTNCLLQNSVESFFYKQIEMSSSRSYRQNERNCVGRGKRYCTTSPFTSMERSNAASLSQFKAARTAARAPFYGPSMSQVATPLIDGSAPTDVMTQHTLTHYVNP